MTVGHERFGVVSLPQPPTKTSGQRPLSFSSGRGKSIFPGRDFRNPFGWKFVIFLILIWMGQNFEKTMVLGCQNGSKNLIFRALKGIGFRP